MLIRRYEGSHSDCTLLATNKYIQVIDAWPLNVVKNVQTVQKVDRRKGKMVGVLLVSYLVQYTTKHNKIPVRIIKNV